MKKLGVMAAVVAAFGFVNAGSAADMPTKAPAPMVAPVFNWSGFYVGAVVGDAWGSSIQFFTTSGSGSTDRYRIKGVNGGGTIGYNWQFDPHWVAGIEADFSGADIKGSGASSPNYGCGTLCDTKVNWFGTLRGRIGYAFNNVLLYGTGGFAYAKITNDLVDLTGSSTRASWTAGGGAEYAFDRNWSAKIEYLYLSFGSFQWTNGASSGANCIGLTCSTDAKFSVVRLGLNYRFGGL